MKNFIKRLIGIDQLEMEAKAALQIKLEAESTADKIREESRVAALTPKEIATGKKEPWVAVMDTHINKENIRNGFFELDWNEYFVLQLRSAGYKGDSDETIVDQWFSELCRNVGAEEGVDMSRRGSGHVDKKIRDDGRTENS